MITMPEFVPGLSLNAAFYAEVVAPLLSPWPHAAARLGSGSDVLGFDTERSTDHGWGLRLVVLVDPASVEDAARAIDVGLPDTYRGWPARYGWDDHPVQHHVEVAALSCWLVTQLGVDPTLGLRTIDWLLIPQQTLLELTRGAVYRDDRGQLSRIRKELSEYPDQPWLWMVAAQWRRIAQEEAFVGRCAEVGDDLGSRLVAARLSRELMRLWFLLHRAYWPYSKWFGSAFQRLPDAERLAEALGAALNAAGYGERQAALEAAYGLVADRHNALGITARVDPQTRLFYARPYRVLMADRFAEATLAQVTDPDLAGLPLIGSIDQALDSTDLLDCPRLAKRFESLYACSRPGATSYRPPGTGPDAATQGPDQRTNHRDLPDPQGFHP
jgi:hypothetical protein